METPNQESQLSLEEQRDNVRDAIWRATGRKEYTEVKRFEDHLIDIEEKIAKEKT